MAKDIRLRKQHVQIELTLGELVFIINELKERAESEVYGAIELELIEDIEAQLDEHLAPDE